MQKKWITTLLVIMMTGVGVALWNIMARGEINLLITVVIAVPMLTIIACAFYPDFWSWFFLFFGITTAYSACYITAGDWGNHWGSNSALSSLCIPIGNAWLHIHHWTEGIILLGIAVRPIVHCKHMRTDHHRGARALFRYGKRLILIGVLMMSSAGILYAQHFTDSRRSIWCILAWIGAFIGFFLGPVCMSREYHQHTFRVCLAIALGISIGLISSGGVEILQEPAHNTSIPSTLIFFSQGDSRCGL